METSDEQWWDAQCGEYVLGTLRSGERDVFEKILKSDADVQARVDYWHGRLSALDSLIYSIDPPAGVLPTILNRIRSDNNSYGASRDGAENTSKNFADTNDIPGLSVADETYDLTSDWTRDLDETLDANFNKTIRQPNLNNSSHTPKKPSSIQREKPRNNTSNIWKGLALLGSAAAIALAALLLRQAGTVEGQLLIPASGSLGIVQDSKQHALWFISLSNDNSNMVSVTAISPPLIQPDQSHQLWAVLNDGSGVSSVGLLPRNSGEIHTMSLSVPIAQADSFAVSLEPAAGSPQATPTGPVLFSATVQTLRESTQ